jgi:WD40 repeat protein
VAGDSTDKDNGEQRSSTDTSGEFFSVGMPLHAVRAGYVRRRADEQLFDAVMAGRYAHVVAPDRSGKTSLIASTAARLESNGQKVAILDLEQIGDRDGGSDSGRWYYSVAYRLLRQLRIRYDLQSWWQDKNILSNRQRLLEFYSEIILQHVDSRIVVFVDEIQCIENLTYADQMLTSIRAAHNARTTDPDFSRLCFVLLGECDPVSLMQEAKLSPFNVTQQIQLDDFSREDLELFSTELNLGHDDASTALDRIYFWTNGQPYLTQKLARAVARESAVENVEGLVDRIATRQLAGRAALHNEPHMSHIHRSIVNDTQRCEPLLNLYGKIRKGIEVPADLGSPLQRRLMAIGLLVIDDESNLKVRNRMYELVFTARWANENLPTRFKVPAIVAGVLLLFAMIPFWYTQWLPNPYVRVLASDAAGLPEATAAYENFRSFPGHADTAENLYRGFLDRRALAANDELDIQRLATLVAEVPSAGRRGDEYVAEFWDRKSRLALREEDRDVALLAKIKSLVLATSSRRQRAASLISDDYPYLLTTLPAIPGRTTVFDPVGMIMTTAVGAEISQYSYSQQGVQHREPWSVTALEVSPLVRRVIIDREGAVSRIGLTLNISHSRLSDLRIKIIAPSGRTVEIETGMERASSDDDIRIPGEQLRELVGESLNGTWSISIRDESLGVAGQLVGWNLKLNSQGAVEYFQRGLNIPDPVERETDNIWFDPSGRYAVARAMQSDSARLWDLAFAEPVRAIALDESEALIGLDASARRLVTAIQDRVNVWDTATGDRIATLPVGAASSNAMLTPDRSSLFVDRRGDAESRLQVWNLDDGTITAEVIVPGVPALVAIDASGSRVAIADFDRAVRVWDFQTTELLGQFDLQAQPGAIKLSSSGAALAAVFPNVGLSLWDVSNPQRPLLQEFGGGQWQFAFSPSGNYVAAGQPEAGFQIFNSADGALIGPPLGVRKTGQAKDILAFSQDEQVLLTGSNDSNTRIWRVPTAGVAINNVEQSPAHTIWSPSADHPLAVAPDGSFFSIGDATGHVHIIPSDTPLSALAVISEDVSFVGHNSEVSLVEIAPSAALVASVAADNTLRLWRTNNGEPLEYMIEISGAPVSHMVFSPNAEYLGLLSGSRVSVVDVSDGTLVAEYETGGVFSGLTFAADDKLYLGSNNGSLQLLSRGIDNNWNLQQVWQGPAGIRVLRASPRGDFLILIDDNNLASQLILAESRLGDATLQLPSEVQEVVFNANGTRAYFRSSRWVHRASLSTSGLIWTDALFVPRALNGAGIVYGDGASDSQIGQRLFLPTSKNGYIAIVELNFDGSSSTKLFGSRDELLEEWRGRTIATPLAESGPVPQALQP